VSPAVPMPTENPNHAMNSSDPIFVGKNGETFCQPIEWLDVVKSFLLNFGLHAFTVISELRCGILHNRLTIIGLKRFGHREDDKCWWCGGTTAQTREHLFCHCSRWKEEQQELWREVGKAMGWKVSRCRNIQISELFSMETCDQAVMDFLAATDIGKFPAQVN
jgi:hypothetical protein